jgi:GNAT superfamily N-acetyltransferase
MLSNRRPVVCHEVRRKPHVLREHGQLVACVAILWEDPDVWGDTGEEAGYVHLLIVDSDNRGTGLGDGVLRWAEHHIRQAGRRLSRLDAVSGNRTLHNWYERRGYAEVGHHTFAEGPWFPVTLREKHLDTQ